MTSILVSKPVIEHCSGDQNENNSSLFFSLSSNDSDYNSTSTSMVDIDCEMKVTVAVTFMAGIIQVNGKKYIFWPKPIIAT